LRHFQFWGGSGVDFSSLFVDKRRPKRIFYIYAFFEIDPGFLLLILFFYGTADGARRPEAFPFQFIDLFSNQSKGHNNIHIEDFFFDGDECLPPLGHRPSHNLVTIETWKDLLSSRPTVLLRIQ
jgi:hypothetical protein